MAKVKDIKLTVDTAKDDRKRFQTAANQWLLDAGMLHEPAAVNTIKANVLGRYRSVRDLEYIYYLDRKQILFHIETKNFWLFSERRRKLIEFNTKEILEDLLPRWEILVTSDRQFFEDRKQAVEDYIYNNKKGESQ